MSPTPSGEHSVYISDGANDVLRTFFTRVEQTWQTADDGKDYEDLAGTRMLILEQTAALVTRLKALLLARGGDGDVRLTQDGALSLFFTYPKTGYSGLFSLSEETNPAKATFRIDT